MRKSGILAAAIAAASALGSRLCNLAGISPRPRLKRTPIAAAMPDDGIRIAPRRAARGWWNQPQSEESAAYYKQRAETRRARRYWSVNASRYVAREYAAQCEGMSDDQIEALKPVRNWWPKKMPPKHSPRYAAMITAAGLGVVSTSCEVLKSARVSLEPGAGICVTSADSKYAVCVNPLTKPISYTLRAGHKGYVMQWDSRTNTWRASTPEGDTAVYDGKTLRIEPALPSTGKATIGTR